MEARPSQGPDFRTATSSADRGFAPFKTAFVPVRTCVVCRQKDARDQLWRLKALKPELVEEQLQLGVNLRGEVVCRDETKRGGGRGAWVHPDCLAGLKQKHLFAPWPRKQRSVTSKTKVTTGK